ncbi:hypothetical protein JCM8547_001993 [Rhodosporidiobolus lusitaniae]
MSANALSYLQSTADYYLQTTFNNLCKQAVGLSAGFVQDPEDWREHRIPLDLSAYPIPVIADGPRYVASPSRNNVTLPGPRFIEHRVTYSGGRTATQWSPRIDPNTAAQRMGEERQMVVRQPMEEWSFPASPPFTFTWKDSHPDDLNEHLPDSQRIIITTTMQQSKRVSARSPQQVDQLEQNSTTRPRATEVWFIACVSFGGAQLWFDVRFADRAAYVPVARRR